MFCPRGDDRCGNPCDEDRDAGEDPRNDLEVIADRVVCRLGGENQCVHGGNGSAIGCARFRGPWTVDRGPPTPRPGTATFLL